MGVLSYNQLNKIYKQLQSVMDQADTINIISKEVNITYDDLSAGGKVIDIVLNDIPENTALIHSEIYLIDDFTDGSGFARFNLGLGTDERLSTDRDPSTYIHNKLVFDALTLDTTGSNVAQGEISGSDVSKVMNKFENNIVGQFYMMGSWSPANDMNTARYHAAGCGTQTNSLCFGGNNPVTSSTEEYDGSSWSAVNNLNTARWKLGGCGTQTAGLSFGGEIPAVRSVLTEEYDGTSWTPANPLNTATKFIVGCGSQSAGLAFGGDDGTLSSKTEEYDGTSWSVAGNMNLAKELLAGCGSQTAGLSFGGSGGTQTTEEYDGTSWTLSNDLNNAKVGLGGCGSQSSALSFGGDGPLAITEEYDGTSWIVSNGLNTARTNIVGSGTQNNGLSFSGLPGPSAVTEEYDTALLSSLTGGELNLYLTYSHQ